MKTYILALRNALYIPSMTHNLIPSFVMREAGLCVNDVLRIHTRREKLCDETYCIAAKEEDKRVNLKIKLQLDGIFSYFDTRKLTAEEVRDCDYIETLHLCPDVKEWDPYDESFAERKEQLMDGRSDLADRPPKQRKVLDDTDLCDIQVSYESYEASISSTVVTNYDRSLEHGQLEMSNTQHPGRGGRLRARRRLHAGWVLLTSPRV